MGALLQFSFEFRTVSCGQCNGTFAVPEIVYERWQRTGETWYCPQGHQRHFAETEVQRLQKQLDQQIKLKQWAQESRDYAQKEAARQERRARAFKGVAKKIKKRVGNGICPCCNRTFQNLMAHMKTQHPKFKGKK